MGFSFDRIIGLHTTPQLLSLHDEIRRALKEDDALPEQNKKYGVREFPDFRAECDAIEAELIRREEPFDPIVW